MNELSTQNQFSISLSNELESVKAALPPDLNIQRFVQNSVALLNGNDTLIKFARQYGTSQIKAGLLRGAYLGLDALNQEMYLIPYGDKLEFMTSSRGMKKMAMKYSTRPIRVIDAKIIREGDKFSEEFVDGKTRIHWTTEMFNDADIKGVFAYCEYEDGTLICESMSKAEIEKCRRQSKAKNASPWSTFWSEMAKKTVIRRLCKSIPIDMDARAREEFETGTEIETDSYEISKKEVEEQTASVPFVVQDDIPEIPEMEGDFT